MCLKTNYFLYDRVIYSQVEGAAIWSPARPTVANLFMKWFEENAIENLIYEISRWKRYVDDTIVVLDSLLEDFINHINSIHCSIKFTREEEKDKALYMLDAQTIRDAAAGYASQCTGRSHTQSNTCSSPATNHSTTN